MAASKGSNAKRSGTKKSGTGNKTTGSRKGGAANRQQGSSVVLADEILFLVALAISLILLFSNLHLCGSVGEMLHSAMRGMMGILGYVFPFFLFGVIVFLISNRQNLGAMLKLLAAVFVFWFLCGILQLFCSEIPDPVWKLASCYETGQTGVSGGVLGGILYALLKPTLGIWGMAVVLSVGLILLMVLITGRSFFQPVRRSSRRIYSTAKADMRRKKESYDEYRTQIRERKQQEKEAQEQAAQEENRRMDRKIRGIMQDTLISREEDASVPSFDFGEPELQASVPSAPEELYVTGLETPVRPEPVYRKETWYQPEPDGEAETVCEMEPEKAPEPLYEEENEADWLSSMSGEIDRIFIQRDIRTLDELDAVEQAGGTALEQAEMTQYPEYGRDAELTELPQSEQPEEIELEQHAVSEILPTEETGGNARFHFKKSAVQVDTRTVTTAAGKVIEVEVKPEDLVDEISRPEGVSAKGDLSEGKESPGCGTGPVVTGSARPVMSGMESQKMPAVSAAGETQQPKAPVSEWRQPKPYVLPSADLLKAVTGQHGRNRDFELKETAAKLQQTLKSFGVGVSVTNISCGPSVTRYEVSPEQGVKVSKIVSLTDDIKLNLAAADIRIEAPIPGKSAVGIEVPNKEKVTVFFREMIESPEFQNHQSRLAFAVGKDLSGRIIVTDLAGMPHLLIAGATGSGKSVCINTLIMSLLFKAKPDEVKLIMVDPKVVELSVYNGIPHLLIPVVTDPKKAAGALNWAVAEMTDRYNKFAEYGVRDLKSYNAKVKRMETDENGESLQPLPQIVIIVDELADLMMVAPGEVEDAICRLAQLARAAGIHLVLATQRPSVNVITGLIKANMPSRIAFAVSSGVDSRTILDMNGAEKLLGKGDMLFSPSGYPKPVRLQGAFVSDMEVSDVVKFIADHADGPVYQNTIAMQMSAEHSVMDGRGSAAERDPYFVQAGLFVIEKEKASSGMLQRAFKIGFNRAARIIDQLAEAGVVGDEEGTKPRKILLTKYEFETYLSENQIQ